MLKKNNDKNTWTETLPKQYLFPFIAAIMVAAAIALIPLWRIEAFILDFGISEIIPMAAPPLGSKARILLCLAGGIFAAAMVYFILTSEGFPKMRNSQNKFQNTGQNSGQTHHGRYRQDDFQNGNSGYPAHANAAPYGQHQVRPDYPAHQGFQQAEDHATPFTNGNGHFAHEHQNVRPTDNVRHATQWQHHNGRKPQAPQKDSLSLMDWAKDKLKNIRFGKPRTRPGTINDFDDLPKLRNEDRHPDAPARRPIFADHDLGLPVMEDDKQPPMGFNEDSYQQQQQHYNAQPEYHNRHAQPVPHSGANPYAHDQGRGYHNGYKQQDHYADSYRREQSPSDDAVNATVNDSQDNGLRNNVHDYVEQSPPREFPDNTYSDNTYSDTAYSLGEPLHDARNQYDSPPFNESRDAHHIATPHADMPQVENEAPQAPQQNQENIQAQKPVENTEQQDISLDDLLHQLEHKLGKPVHGQAPETQQKPIAKQPNNTETVNPIAPHQDAPVQHDNIEQGQDDKPYSPAPWQDPLKAQQAEHKQPAHKVQDSENDIDQALKAALDTLREMTEGNG